MAVIDVNVLRNKREIQRHVERFEQTGALAIFNRSAGHSGRPRTPGSSARSAFGQGAQSSSCGGRVAPRALVRNEKDLGVKVNGHDWLTLQFRCEDASCLGDRADAAQRFVSRIRLRAGRWWSLVLAGRSPANTA